MSKQDQKQPMSNGGAAKEQYEPKMGLAQSTSSAPELSQNASAERFIRLATKYQLNEELLERMEIGPTGISAAYAEIINGPLSRIPEAIKDVNFIQFEQALKALKNIEKQFQDFPSYQEHVQEMVDAKFPELSDEQRSDLCSRLADFAAELSPDFSDMVERSLPVLHELKFPIPANATFEQVGRSIATAFSLGRSINVSVLGIMEYMGLDRSIPISVQNVEPTALAIQNPSTARAYISSLETDVLAQLDITRAFYESDELRDLASELDALAKVA